MNTTKIIRNVTVDDFQALIKKYSDKILVSTHALDHISDSQRKIFHPDILINTVLKERPLVVGLQNNGRYALFYKRKWGYLRIIVNVTNTKVEIITFLNTENIPEVTK